MPLFFGLKFRALNQHPFPLPLGGKGFPPFAGTGFSPFAGFGAGFAIVLSFHSWLKIISVANVGIVIKRIKRIVKINFFISFPP